MNDLGEVQRGMHHGDVAAVAREISRRMPASWPWTALEGLRAELARMEDGVANMDVLSTLAAVRDANRRLTDIATAVLEIAAVETTITQKKLADTLDVPPRALSGLRR